MENNLLDNGRASYLRKEELLVLINSLSFDRVKYFKLEAITGYKNTITKDGNEHIDTFGFEIEIT